MQIISQPEVSNTLSFGTLECGAVFQREGSTKLYLKSSHSTEGSNAVRISTGLRSTLKVEEPVIVRDDACVRFNATEG